jgi:hypothetical protein
MAVSIAITITTAASQTMAIRCNQDLAELAAPAGADEQGSVRRQT